MKKFLLSVVIVASFCLIYNFVPTKAQDQAAQNDMLQQYLQSKQQQQAKQAQTQAQQTQNTNVTTQSGLKLNNLQKILLVVYSVTILLAWTNLILGVFALIRWIKLKKSPAEINKKMIS